MRPPVTIKFIPIFVLVSSRAGRVRACGTVIVAACLYLLVLVVAVFITLSRPHAVSVRGAESAQDPFAFDLQHQLVDAKIGLGAFVGGYIASDVVTVAAAGRCGCYDAERLQLRHGGKNSVVLRGGFRDQCSASITTVLPVAVEDRDPKSTSNFSMKEAGAPAIWLPGVPAVVEGLISRTIAAECMEPKALLQTVASLNSRLRAFWRRKK